MELFCERFSVRWFVLAVAIVAGLLGFSCGYHRHRAEWHGRQAMECGERADAISEYFLSHWDRYGKCPEGPIRDPLMGTRIALVKNRIYHANLLQTHLNAAERPWSSIWSAAPPLPPPRPPTSVTDGLLNSVNEDRTGQR